MAQLVGDWSGEERFARDVIRNRGDAVRIAQHLLSRGVPCQELRDLAERTVRDGAADVEQMVGWLRDHGLLR